MPDEHCPIPTAEQRQLADIQALAEKRMFDTIAQAIRDAHAEVAANYRKAGITLDPPHEDYYAAAAQQATFVRLCGGNPATLKGGDPGIGERVLQNGRDILEHYWR